MRKVGLENEEIDRVVYIGGSSRILAVKEMLKKFFPSSVHDSEANPQEIVALGAA